MSEVFDHQERIAARLLDFYLTVPNLPGSNEFPYKLELRYGENGETFTSPFYPVDSDCYPGAGIDWYSQDSSERLRDILVLERGYILKDVQMRISPIQEQNSA